MRKKLTYNPPYNGFAVCVSRAETALPGLSRVASPEKSTRNTFFSLLRFLDSLVKQAETVVPFTQAGYIVLLGGL